MTESLWDWSRTAATNANSDSAIDWAEGMSPATINNSARAMMAATAKFVYDISGQIVTGGTSTVLTATTASTFTSLTEGKTLVVEMGVTCGDNPTMNVDTRGAKKLYKFSKTGNGAPVQISAGEMQLGGRYVLQYDTSLDTAAGGWIVLNPSEDALQAPWTNIASAATVNIGAANSANLQVTGTTNITAFDTVPSGVRRLLRFSGVLTITHNATSMILPGAANYTTAAGDILEFTSLGSGNWACTNRLRAAGYNSGDVIKVATYTDVGSSTASTVMTNANVGAFSFTPRSANSTIIIIASALATEQAIAATNTIGSIEIRESGSLVGSSYNVAATGVTDGVATTVPVTIQVALSNAATAARSFSFYHKTNNAGALMSTTVIKWTIMEVAA